MNHRSALSASPHAGENMIGTCLRLIATALILLPPVALAADLTVRELVKKLFELPPGDRSDFSGYDLSGLDLSGTNFKGALLNNTNLFGADLTGANLSSASLKGASLDRSTLIKADFAMADLSGATIRSPAAFRSPGNARLEVPSFSGANLQRGRLVGDYLFANFRGANLSGVDVSPSSKDFALRPSVNDKRSKFELCDFSRSTLVQADLAHASFRYSRFEGADLRGANLSYADFSGASLKDANLSGANNSHTSFDGADLDGVIGISADGR